MQHAVLFLGYNRPEPAARVLDAITAAAPPRVYVALDGPRAQRPGDAARVRAVQDLVTSTAWPGERQVLFREHNLGCGIAVRGALDWFFDREPAGIVLEDDCLPSPGFFDFADAMLTEHANDQRVWMVSGFNHVGRWHSRRGTHFFSDGGVWGWASWRDRWQRNDPDLTTYDAESEHRIAAVTGRAYWQRVRRGVERVQAGEVDTWDYQWAHARLRRGGLTVVPTRSLVTNIGSGAASTHTTSWDPQLHRRRYDMHAPYRPVGPVAMDRSYLHALQAQALVDGLRVRVHSRGSRARARWQALRRRDVVAD